MKTLKQLVAKIREERKMAKFIGQRNRKIIGEGKPIKFDCEELNNALVHASDKFSLNLEEKGILTSKVVADIYMSDEYENEIGYKLEDLPTPEDIREHEQEMFWVATNGVYNSPYTSYNRIKEVEKTNIIEDRKYIFNKVKEINMGTSEYLLGINIFSDTQASICNNIACNTYMAREGYDDNGNHINGYKDIWNILREQGFLGIKLSSIHKVYERKWDGRNGGSWEYLDDNGYPYIPKEHMCFFKEWDFYPVRTIDDKNKKATRNYISAKTGRTEVLKCKVRPDMPKGGLLGRMANDLISKQERKLGYTYDHGLRRDKFILIMNKISKRVSVLVEQYYELLEQTKLNGDLEFDIDSDGVTKYYCPCCGSDDVITKGKTPYEFKDRPVVKSLINQTNNKAHECVYNEDFNAEDVYKLEWIDPNTGELVKWTYKSSSSNIYTTSLDKPISGDGDNKDILLCDIIPDEEDMFDNIESIMPCEITEARHKFEQRRADVVKYLNPIHIINNGKHSQCNGYNIYAKTIPETNINHKGFKKKANVDEYDMICKYAEHTIKLRKDMRK